MSYQTVPTQTPPSMPFYGIAPDYRPHMPYDAGITTYPIYGRGPVDTMFMNYIEGGMQNNLLWDPPFFDTENDFGYNPPAATDKYGPRPSAQDFPYFVANGESIPPQTPSAPVVPVSATPMATNFFATLDDFSRSNSDSAPIAPIARSQESVYRHYRHTSVRHAPYPQRGPAMVDPRRRTRHQTNAPIAALPPPKQLPMPPIPSILDPSTLVEAFSRTWDEPLAGWDEGLFTKPTTASPAPHSPLDLGGPHRPSAPVHSLVSSSVSSGGRYQAVSSYTFSDLALQPSGGDILDVQWPPAIGYGEHEPPTTAHQPPAGYLPPFGLPTRPEHESFETTGSSTSSEGGILGALKQTNRRSKTSFPREGSPSKSDAQEILSSEHSRPTMEPPAPGCSSARKRQAEEEDGDEGEERQKKRRLSKEEVQATSDSTQPRTSPARPPHLPRSVFGWLVVSGRSTAANTAIGVDANLSATSLPTRPHRFACPVEDCYSTVKGSESGGLSRHILESHHGGEGLWVCRCGRCFKMERNRNAHRDACKLNTSGWEAWDRRIKQIHKTMSTSLLEEYQTAHVTEGEEAWVRGEWRKLGIAGVILSVHASDPFRCQPRHKYEDRVRELKEAGMWQKGRYIVQQNVKKLYQHIERLRVDGGV